jgi:site-specific DNA-methyltransferase (adenine-specific)
VTVRVEHGDCLEVLPQLAAEGVVVDAIVTDPPYHLQALAKRFGKPSSAPAQYGRDGAMARLSGGFMGLGWDGGDVAFRPETWAAAASVLRPGGILLAFGGSRTYHRLASAIEDAGFVIQDQIMWLYGSGFPKRRDMLKPAHEPVVMAYKPGSARTLAIEECRIGTDRTLKARSVHDFGRINDDSWQPKAGENGSPAGRYPANVIHDGSEEVLDAFAAYGERASGNMRPATRRSRSAGTVYGKMSPVTAGATHGDSGSIARFFYQAKADAGDRNGSRHPTVKPLALIRYLVRLVTPPGGTVLDLFAGTGTTGEAAEREGRDAILIEREAEYIADINRRLDRIRGADTPLFAGATA